MDDRFGLINRLIYRFLADKGPSASNITRFSVISSAAAIYFFTSASINSSNMFQRFDSSEIGLVSLLPYIRALI